MFRIQREELVDEITKKGITDLAVIKAIGIVPREKFVEKTMHHMAYKDVALPIGYDQTISQPYTVAFMTQLLNIKKPGMKILEIGTGSGYQAAVLFEMKAEVFSIERNVDLHHRAAKLFDKLGIRVHAKYGDGTIASVETHRSGDVAMTVIFDEERKQRTFMASLNPPLVII